ncbi:hypothetical protein HAX54_006265 [Datura stramonium]|uniref:DUF4283 domain-containing protein n=1 Tax=Datura stramonium TaxID=4076 RepID=A0ABS8TAT4_DATST|nr:hypothetical protein [Datura stramonium]
MLTPLTCGSFLIAPFQSIQEDKELGNKNWVVDFRFDPETITTIPFWVNFPELQVGYWSIEALSKVASVVCSHTGEVDISRRLMEYVSIDIPAGVIEQNIVH